MKTTTSKDGTVIAYEELGSGPPVVLVDGAFCHRRFGPMPDLAPLLAKHFTVYHYDRRGRGDSGDTPPHAVERELEDLAAVAAVAGGNPCIYGTSSGAALTLRAVGSGVVRAKKLALFEPPFALDGTRFPDPPDYIERIAKMLESSRPDDAAKMFLKVVGVPRFGIFFMRLMPNVWPKLRAVAHTLPYDFAALGDTQRGAALPAELEQKLRAIDAPTLALVGGKSPAWMQHAVKVVSQTIPGASLREIPGQEHNIAAKALAPVLIEHFLAR